MRFNKVFIIDDDKIFHFIIKKLLVRQNASLELSFFENGLEAIEHLRLQASSGGGLPDIIFLDINMPVLDGWQFLDEYKDLRSQLQREPIIYLISSSDNATDRDKALEYKDMIRQYFLKPMGQPEIESIFLN